MARNTPAIVATMVRVKRRDAARGDASDSMEFI